MDVRIRKILICFSIVFALLFFNFVSFNIHNISALDTEEYTITFDSNGGSLVEPITAIAGEAFIKPSDPVRDGFNFVGWYMDSACITPYDWTNSAGQNLTLYADWSGFNPYTRGFTDFLLYIMLGLIGAFIIFLIVRKRIKKAREKKQNQALKEQYLAQIKSSENQED